MERHAYREANWEAKYCGVVLGHATQGDATREAWVPPTPSMICWKVDSLWTKPHDIKSYMFCVAVGLAGDASAAQPAMLRPAPADVAPNRFSQ